MSVAKLDNWSKKASIKTALNVYSDELPFVVRSVNSQPLPARAEAIGCLPQGVAVMLEKVVVMEFVHIRILPYHDDNKMSMKFGGEFVLYHNNFLNGEFLIPKTYPMKLRLVPRPGKRQRYVSAKQIAEECPHIIRVEQETRGDGLLRPLLGQFRTIPEHTELKVIGVSQNHIKCEDKQGHHFKFHFDTPMNCTYVEDTHHYTMDELLQLPLPKVAVFDDINEVTKVVMSEQSQCDEVRMMLTGPIEILGQRQIEMAIGWSRDRVLKTFPTLLVPSGSWSREEICVGQFPSRRHKNEYLEDQFGPCMDSGFIVDSLYILPVKDDFITTLLHPESSTFPFIEYDDTQADDTYDDVSDADTPPPTPPPRRKMDPQSTLCRQNSEGIQDNCSSSATVRHDIKEPSADTDSEECSSTAAQQDTKYEPLQERSDGTYAHLSDDEDSDDYEPVCPESDRIYDDVSER